MTFRRISIILIITFTSLFNQAFAQSLGMIYEASSFSLEDFYYAEYSRPSGLIKNVFINYSTPMFESFFLSIKTGYGFNTNRYSDNSGNEKYIYEEITQGIPVELDMQYHHYFDKDSVLEPIFGLGLGYYYYESKIERSHSVTEDKFTSGGAAQYIMIGMNINLSPSILTSIQFKKFMFVGISTEHNYDGRIESEKDYSQGNGLDDISVSFGIFFKVYY